jgi:hypothetical protein
MAANTVVIGVAKMSTILLVQTVLGWLGFDRHRFPRTGTAPADPQRRGGMAAHGPSRLIKPCGTL